MLAIYQYSEFTIIQENHDEGIIISGTKSYGAIKDIFESVQLNFHIPLPSLKERCELWNVLGGC